MGFYKKILESFDMVVLNVSVGFKQFNFNTNPQSSLWSPWSPKFNTNPQSSLWSPNFDTNPQSSLWSPWSPNFNTNPQAMYGPPVSIKSFHSLFVYIVVPCSAGCLVLCAISPLCTVPEFVS